MGRRRRRSGRKTMNRKSTTMVGGSAHLPGGWVKVLWLGGTPLIRSNRMVEIGNARQIHAKHRPLETRPIITTFPL